MNEDGFLRRQSHGIPYYSCKAFEEVAHLRHGFSTRIGGVPDSNGSFLNLHYSPSDSAERVDENRRRFLSALHIDSSRLATLRQVHSNRVHIIDDNSGQWNQPEGDALITGRGNVALAVKSADCMPVLLADPSKGVVAAVHAGWRGTLARVLYETVVAMRQVFGCDPADILAATGPGIRACCFEVGPEVAALFEREFPGVPLARPSDRDPGKYCLDLNRALENQLSCAGVQLENCFDLGACTCCRTDEFFSYRAEGPASGRMMAVISFLKQG